MSGDRYKLRPALTADLPELPVIAKAASELFPPERLVVNKAVSEDAFARGLGNGLLWIVETGGTPVGFLLAERQGQELHLVEMDVHPEHGAQGLGTLLLRQLIDFAEDTGFRAITLSTYDEFRWNAPFYTKMGFDTVPEAQQSPRLRSLVVAEQEAGLTDRVIMHLKLNAAGLANPAGLTG